MFVSQKKWELVPAGGWEEVRRAELTLNGLWVVRVATFYASGEETTMGVDMLFPDPTADGDVARYWREMGKLLLEPSEPYRPFVNRTVRAAQDTLVRGVKTVQSFLQSGNIPVCRAYKHWQAEGWLVEPSFSGWGHGYGLEEGDLFPISATP